ncbi:MAG: tyrosine-type recombinase/integrase [Chloroflexi bacterium]|nr:tyrosine-type recombinase/integrase [Chloroflexota bacterium]
MTKAYLDPEEVDLMEEASPNLRDKLLIRLLFHLGCRVSEGLGISTGDINLSKGTVIIQHLKTRLRLSCPGCGARLGQNSVFCARCGAKVIEVVAKEMEHRRQRQLPVDSKTLDMLKEFVERGGPVVRDGKRFLFGINRHRAWQIVRECADRAGLPKLVNTETGRVHGVSPHRLRDAFATHAVKVNDSGDGLRLLQQHLGHASFNTTAKYRKISGEEQQAWYNRIWEEDKR